jgi:hypothetical protein
MYLELDVGQSVFFQTCGPRSIRSFQYPLILDTASLPTSWTGYLRWYTKPRDDSLSTVQCVQEEAPLRFHGGASTLLIFNICQVLLVTKHVVSRLSVEQYFRPEFKIVEYSGLDCLF